MQHIISERGSSVVSPPDGAKATTAVTKRTTEYDANKNNIDSNHNHQQHSDLQHHHHHNHHHDHHNRPSSLDLTGSESSGATPLSSGGCDGDAGGGVGMDKLDGTLTAKTELLELDDETGAGVEPGEIFANQTLDTTDVYIKQEDARKVGQHTSDLRIFSAVRV